MQGWGPWGANRAAGSMSAGRTERRWAVQRAAAARGAPRGPHTARRVQLPQRWRRGVVAAPLARLQARQKKCRQVRSPPSVPLREGGGGARERKGRGWQCVRGGRLSMHGLSSSRNVSGKGSTRPDETMGWV